MTIRLEDDQATLIRGMLEILNHFEVGEISDRPRLAAEIIGHTFSKLRRRLNPRLPQMVYEEIMASAQRRFFVRLTQGQPGTEFASLDEASDLFVGIVYFVMHEKLRRTKRDRAVALPDVGELSSSNEFTTGGLAEEVVDCVLSQLPDPIDREILNGKLEGLELSEIQARLAAQPELARTERTISVRWKRISELLKHVGQERGLIPGSGLVPSE